MLEKIINILKKNDISCYRITESKNSTCEVYYIKKELDMPRLKEMTMYNVTVFRDFNMGDRKFRGESNTIINPGMEESDIENRIKSAYLAASFVKNPWYELADPVSEPLKADDSDLSKMELSEAATLFSKEMFSVDTEEDAFINSAEIFVERSYKRIITSNGTDVSFTSNNISGEMVTQCVKPIDVEQFREFSYDKFDTDGIKKKTLEAINDVRARARANKSPKAGNYDIILTGENLVELFQFYGARTSAMMVFPGYSKWQVGTNVQGDVVGEKLNITFLPKSPYSPEGIPMPERTLIKDGEVQLIYGPTRLCRYMGIEPTGNYEKIRLDNGIMPLKEMRKNGVLEPISFSHFQMDPMDGHFKGEIRLALLHKEDGTVEEITGGSINGSIIDAQGNLKFSTDRYEDSNYIGPLAILIPNVAVAGE